MTAPALRERRLDDLLRARHYIVVGANSGGDAVARYLEGQGKTIAAYADLDPAKAGVERQGYPVVAIGEVPALITRGTAIVIGSFKHREIGARLINELGVAPDSVFPYVNAMFARHYDPDIYRRHGGEIARVRAALSDAPSRAYFDRLIAFYRTLDPLYLEPNPQAYGAYGYDAPGARPAKGSVIVDCGAFTGDTCDFYLAETDGDCRLFAIEAYMPNYLRLNEWLNSTPHRSRVKALHLAIGAETGALCIDGDPSLADGGAHAAAMASAPGSTDLVLCETLDNLFTRHFPLTVDHIKVDVEGADLDVVRGGLGLLKRDRPTLAIASYHTPEHIWQIPLTALEALGPCRLYAAHDPAWVHHIHYLIVPEGSRL